MSADFATLLGRLLAREPIAAGDVRAAFDAILSGAWTPAKLNRAQLSNCVPKLSQPANRKSALLLRSISRLREKLPTSRG